MRIIKNNILYIVVFIISFILLILFGSNNTDIIWNYGDCIALTRGLIPYKDFNIITTPLYPLLMSSFLFLNSNYYVFILEQSLLITILFYVIDKNIGHKSILLFSLSLFPNFYILFPNYNFFVVFLVIIIYLLDKKNYSDLFVGILLGLLILTKHTIGGVILICSLISTFSLKKSLKRIGGCILPGIVFIIYLIITKSFYNFINLSIFGLFDFNNKNNLILPLPLIIFILIIIYLIYSFIKNPKEKANYYLLGSLIFVYPIIDYFHINYLIFITLYFILEKIKIKNNKKYMEKISVFIIIELIFFNIISNINYYKNIHLYNINHFQGYYMHKEDYKYFDAAYKKYKKYNNCKMISMQSMLFDIAADKNINYFDIPLYGNFGYDGINNMKKKISKMHNTYIFINYFNNRQFARELCDYVKKKGKYIEKVGDYEIYYIE